VQRSNPDVKQKPGDISPGFCFYSAQIEEEYKECFEYEEDKKKEPSRTCLYGEALFSQSDEVIGVLFLFF